jgi:hypothetical protein
MWNDVDKMVVNITFFDDFKEQKKRSHQQSCSYTPETKPR